MPCDLRAEDVVLTRPPPSAASNLGASAIRAPTPPASLTLFACSLLGGGNSTDSTRRAPRRTNASSPVPRSATRREDSFATTQALRSDRTFSARAARRFRVRAPRGALLARCRFDYPVLKAIVRGSNARRVVASQTGHRAPAAAWL